MAKKKSGSLLKFLLILICLLSIAVSLTINIAFSKGKTPKLFGRYIYIVEQNVNFGADSKITPGSAVFAADASDVTLTEKDIVIAYPAGDPNNLHVAGVYAVTTADDGSIKYRLYYNGAEDTAGGVSKESVIAICTGYNSSEEIGKFITFAKSITGILVLLILPCVLLVIMLIARIASAAGGKDEDDSYDFYEYDENEKKAAPEKPSHAKTGSPLFEASQEIQPSNELELKKMSIAENFSQKKVNPDSPYQKEKERTMQFKTQRSAETSFAARNMGGTSSTAPTADALREEMLRKNAEAERTGSFSIKNAVPAPAAPQPAEAHAAPDNTGVLSKAQLAEMSRNDIPKTTPLRSQSSAPSAAPKKSSSPDIGDIIKKSDTNARKKSAADMSVDDLLKLIEDEKNKL